MHESNDEEPALPQVHHGNTNEELIVENDEVVLVRGIHGPQLRNGLDPTDVDMSPGILLLQRVRVVLSEDVVVDLWKGKIVILVLCSEITTDGTLSHFSSEFNIRSRANLGTENLVYR
jgi:hypothetical protein